MRAPSSPSPACRSVPQMPQPLKRPCKALPMLAPAGPGRLPNPRPPRNRNLSWNPAPAPEAEPVVDPEPVVEPTPEPVVAPEPVVTPEPAPEPTPVVAPQRVVFSASKQRGGQGGFKRA